MELTRKLFRDINDNNTSSILFLDYSRAFNTVDHGILLRKLSMYGLSTDVCKWFENYFIHRTQITRVGSVLSSGETIEHGVYQGSPLGPLLFIIYINDLVNIMEDTFCNMYADDTVIVSNSASKRDAMEHSWSMFNSINEWCSLNRICVNKKKTKHMLSGKRDYEKSVNDMNDLDIRECGIDTVENFVYLGVNIDNKLCFEKFINGTISRVNGRLITFSKIRKMIDVRTSLAIYKQTILPIIDYMSILINSSTQRKIKKLQPLQNRAIRIIENCYGYISTPVMTELHVKHHLKLLKERRRIFMLKLMYKLSKDAENVNTYRPEMMLRTAPKVKMKIQFTDKERVRRSPYYLCNQLWDNIDSQVQTAISMFEFTKGILLKDLSV